MAAQKTGNRRRRMGDIHAKQEASHPSSHLSSQEAGTGMGDPGKESSMANLMRIARSLGPSKDEMGEAEWARSRRHNSITPAIIWSAMILTICQFPCQCQLMSLPVSLCALPCALRPYHTVAYISQSQSQSQTKPRTITINNNNRKLLLGFDCLDQYRGHGWRMASTDEHNPTRHVH
jgi:hypothetical protein